MFRASVLGVVQGVTEFVPISSSGHLLLVPFLLGWEVPDLAFDVALHLGTALPVLAYFRREIGGMLLGLFRTAVRRADGKDRGMAKLAGLIVVGTVPAALAGLLLERFVSGLAERPEVAAVLLFVTAGLLLAAERYYSRRGTEARDISRVRFGDAAVMGFFQALALAPGISRAGSTIAGGIFRGLARDAAARFSMLLALPAILGAGILQLPDIPPGIPVGTVVVATPVSAVTGFLAIAFLLRYLRTRDMRPFAYYSALFGA